MKQIIIFPMGAVTKQDRERMSKAGYLPIETDDPSKVIMPIPGSTVTGDVLTMCLMNAISKASVLESVPRLFLYYLHNHLKRDHVKK